MAEPWWPSLAAFGFYRRKWMGIEWSKYPSVGNIDVVGIDRPTEFPDAVTRRAG